MTLNYLSTVYRILIRVTMMVMCISLAPVNSLAQPSDFMISWVRLPGEKCKKMDTDAALDLLKSFEKELQTSYIEGTECYRNACWLVRDPDKKRDFVFTDKKVDCENIETRFSLSKEQLHAELLEAKKRYKLKAIVKEEKKGNAASSAPVNNKSEVNKALEVAIGAVKQKEINDAKKQEMPVPDSVEIRKTEVILSKSPEYIFSLRVTTSGRTTLGGLYSANTYSEHTTCVAVYMGQINAAYSIRDCSGMLPTEQFKSDLLSDLHSRWKKGGGK